MSVVPKVHHDYGIGAWSISHIMTNDLQSECEHRLFLINKRPVKSQGKVREFLTF